MPINWFPGHMNKALRELTENAQIADIFIVVVDARGPIASYNEAFDQVTPHKPRLFVWAKADMADELKTQKLISRFNHPPNYAYALNLKMPSARKKIINILKQMASEKLQKKINKGFAKVMFNVMVVGIPNVGKSTLINLLSASAKTKVADMPGTTRRQQWVEFDTFRLLDTPGILPPKIENDKVAMKLIALRTIKRDIVPMTTIAHGLYALVSTYYPDYILRLGLSPTTESNSIHDNLTLFGEKKGFQLAGGTIDMARTITFFVQYVENLRGVTYDDL